MTAKQVDSRTILNFPEEVRKEFSFLEGLGFNPVLSLSTLVRYESKLIGINVYHGRTSFEIGAEIYERQNPGESYSLSELLRLVSAAASNEYKKFAARDRGGVARGVHQLAARVQDLTDSSILADVSLFKRLADQRRQLTDDYAIQTQLRRARELAEAAWYKRDFRTVIAILSPWKEYLTTVELKKLEYSREKLADL
jgi:hypothetical protein